MDALAMIKSSEISICVYRTRYRQFPYQIDTCSDSAFEYQMSNSASLSIMLNGTTKNGSTNGGPPIAHGSDTHDVQQSQMLEMVLQNLASATQAALSFMQGPLKSTLEEQLHAASTLPDAHLSTLAAETIDLLHKAQQALEPRSVVLADHFLGTSHSHSPNFLSAESLVNKSNLKKRVCRVQMLERCR